MKQQWLKHQWLTFECRWSWMGFIGNRK